MVWEDLALCYDDMHDHPSASVGTKYGPPSPDSLLDPRLDPI